MVKELIDKMEYWYKEIHEDKCRISELKTDKAEQRNRYWGEATGIAKEKEDYIKAMTSKYDEEIRKLEAHVEYAYNMVDILNWRLMYTDD